MQFNKWTGKSLYPMTLMIYFGGKEAAEIFLKDFIESCKYGKRIKNYYMKLMENETANFFGRVYNKNGI
jgi:hypothetical protein